MEILVRRSDAPEDERAFGFAPKKVLPLNVVPRTGCRTLSPTTGATASWPAARAVEMSFVRLAIARLAGPGPNDWLSDFVRLSRPSIATSRSMSARARACHSKKDWARRGVVVPFLGEVLARRGFVPDEPLLATVNHLPLDEPGHVTDHRAEQSNSSSNTKLETQYS